MKEVNTPSTHVSWTKIWVFVAALGLPIYSATIGAVILGKGALDKIDGFGIRLTKVENKIDDVSVKVDTIQRRQERSDMVNSFRFKEINK